MFRISKSWTEKSGRCWWKNVDIYLKKIVFHSVETDPSLYMKRNQGTLTSVGVYVDYLMIASRPANDLTAFIKLLEQRYSIRTPQTLSYILGVLVNRDWKKCKLFRKFRYKLLVQSSINSSSDAHDSSEVANSNINRLAITGTYSRYVNYFRPILCDGVHDAII